MPDLPLQHRFQVVFAPAVEPITVSEAKAQMRIEHSDDDALIARLIDVAVSFVDVRGTFQGEFEVTYATGEIETFPNDGFLAIEIIDDIA